MLHLWWSVAAYETLWEMLISLPLSIGALVVMNILPGSYFFFYGQLWLMTQFCLWLLCVPGMAGTLDSCSFKAASLDCSNRSCFHTLYCCISRCLCLKGFLVSVFAVSLHTISSTQPASSSWMFSSALRAATFNANFLLMDEVWVDQWEDLASEPGGTSKQPVIHLSASA